MTMIKKDGHWVTVAGGQRMWVGTKAQLDAALAAGELEDGTAIMVTDDYEEANKQPIFVGTATKSAYVTAGSITWQWTGRICRVLFEGVKLAANTPFLSDICTGLPPANGTEFMTVCAEFPTTVLVGFLRTDRNNGKLQADATVGGQTVEVTLYASVSYITSEVAHSM